MQRVFAAIWFSAFSLAGLFILALLWSDWNAEPQFPAGYKAAMSGKIVFIGSSLTGSALPAQEPAAGILEDGRSTAILSSDGIGERLSNRLLADAIDARAGTVFLEINAYAHEYIGLTEPAFLGPAKKAMRELGGRMTAVVKGMLSVDHDIGRSVRLGPFKMNGTLQTERIQPQEYYRFLTHEPADAGALRALLSRARKSGVEVLFFSPPRPRSAIAMMGVDDLAELHVHINRIAGSFDVPLWYSSTPWPDDHFMDVLAHGNERGRSRLQKELARWYGARR